jgi:DNA-binding NtrC family response regulator
MIESSSRLVGVSDHIERIRRDIGTWSRCDEPILIVGESGTGKEVVARALHAGSGRADRPLHVVNCAALAPEVLMAELFGHVRGAYTGAIEARPGRLRRADGATLLLDEITESSPNLQSALLRVIEQGEVQPVGADSLAKVDVRILATTNRSPDELCAGSALRGDLLHRLGTLVVKLQPLRERPEDIRPLTDMFLADIRCAEGQPPRLTEGAYAELETAHLSGNARELRQILVRAVAAFPGEPVHALAVRDAMAAGIHTPTSGTQGAVESTGGTLADVIRAHIAATLDATRGNLSEAARRLDVPRSTLQHYLVRYGIDRDAAGQSRTRSA